jgi:hypothetical protein
MTHWKGPTFIKKTVNGKQIQIYKFLLESPLEQFTIIGSASSKLSELVVESVWIPLLNEFIQTFGRLFNKPITADYIYKNAIHIKNPELTDVTEEVEWTLYSISIDSGKFIIEWNYNTIQKIDVDINEHEENEIVPIDDIITSDISEITDINEIKPSKPRNASYLHREKARQRVKELRLNARLSYFRAKQEQRKFEERFGAYESEYPTDDSSEDSSLWSDSDLDESEQ